MTYQTANAKSAYQLLRSIALIRPASCLGPAFLAKQHPHGATRQMAERTLHLARKAMVDATDASKAEVGACNKLSRKDRHNRGIYSDRPGAYRLSTALGTVNPRRAHLLRTREAVVAAEAALLALAN